MHFATKGPVLTVRGEAGGAMTGDVERVGPGACEEPICGGGIGSPAVLAELLPLPTNPQTLKLPPATAVPDGA